MSTEPAPVPIEAPRPEPPALRRDPVNGYLGGVLAGLAGRLGVDPLLVRIGFGIVAIATFGAALAVYALAWIAIPSNEADASEGTRRGFVSLTANTRVASGVGLLTLALLLIMRELGIWWSDALIWPLILASFGAALLWRQSRPVSATSGAANGPGIAVPRTGAERSRLIDLYRGGFGVALIAGAALIVLSTTGALDAAGDVFITTLVVALALALILAPFWWRLGRNLATERGERIRSQERAAVAAHLHDSVLQTLTLVQKRSDDPREVAQLARRQERELREWLFAPGRAPAATSVATALEEAAIEVEEAHRVPVEVVAVGDARMGARGEALVSAAREAIVNAAKFAADAGEIAVYAELSDARAHVFVRDRGSGFDPERTPGDRRGVRESIIGRMQRAGGTARIRSDERGTEVALEISPEGG